MTRSVELIELELELLHQTDDAFLVLSDFDKNVWVPKSVCNNWEKIEASFKSGKADVMQITLPAWIATKKGLI